MPRSECSGFTGDDRRLVSLELLGQAQEDAGSFVELAKPAESGRELAAVHGRRSRDTQPQADDPRRGGRVALHQRVVQVGEDPIEDGARRRDRQVVERKLGCVAVHRMEHRAATLDVEYTAAVERVEPHRIIAARGHEEVARHANAAEGDARSVPDFHHQDAERDGDTQATSEHVVEIRVAGIAVVDSVPREPELDEEPAPEHGRLVSGSLVGECVEVDEPALDVEAGMSERGDEQRGLVERNLALGAADDLGEPRHHVHGSTLPPPPADADRAPVASCAWKPRCAPRSSPG